MNKRNQILGLLVINMLLLVGGCSSPDGEKASTKAEKEAFVEASKFDPSKLTPAQRAEMEAFMNKAQEKAKSEARKGNP